MTTTTPTRRRGLAQAVRWTVHGIAVGVREIWWWLSGPFRFLWRAPGRAVVWLTGTVGAYLTETWLLLTGLGLVALVPGVWARGWPDSYLRHITHPGWRRRIRRSVNRSWNGLMEACGLSRRVIGKDGPEIRVPVLHRIGWEDPDVLVVVPQLMVGQTVEDVVTVSDRLRVAVGSRQVRVVPNDTHTGCAVRFLFTDPLAQIVYATFPALDAVPTIEWAEMGVTEDGQPWRSPIRVHTITGGSSGAGKSFAQWVLLTNLAPAIKTGLVQVHSIDLKGGVEHAMGLPLFTRHATSMAAAVVVLEDAVTAMMTRSQKMAGHVRAHIPTVAEPMVVVLIDELAMLTSYSTDRDLLRRADTALRTLLALGRAPGYIVYGYVQDPRKDTVPQRHLFNQAYALRLREREEVVMLLSEGAVAAGAACHKIPRSTPGIGYALAENGTLTRVRVAFVSDDMIRALAAHFPAPVRIPVVLPTGNDEPPASRTRSPRKPRSPRGGADHD